MKGERVILGVACPECGGTEYYCADCLDDLHGEGEKGEEQFPWVCPFCNGTRQTCKCVRPSPTPTREEWEAFENELRKRYELCPSNAPADSILLAVLNAVAAVNRAMPIVPKE